MSLSEEQRNALPDSDFAVPGKRELPIHDATHTCLAWDLVDRTGGLSDAERREARERIKHRAAELGIDTAGWTAAVRAQAEGLYVRRNLTPESAAALRLWAGSQGFPHLVPEHELHATVVYSRVPVALAPQGGTLTAAADGRRVAGLGDKGAVVLHFTSPALENRWQEALTAGATWDHDGYQPHVTITYDAPGTDLSAVTPFDGVLEFGPEIHEPINESWAEENGFRVTLQAMALDVPNTPGHPNKHPFKGVLTRIDEPSDRPPEGSRGHRVVLTRAAAEAALPTLLGMPVDFTSDLSGHDVRSKIGTITAATIEGNAIHIEGFLYAADFPDEVARVQSQRDALGFSYELAHIYVKDVSAAEWEITGCVFTGAAILYKDKAAYTTTSLAAQAEENTDMTKEMLEAVEKLTEMVGAVNTRLDKIEAAQAETVKTVQAGKEHMTRVEPHAAALERVADDMETDGVGGHPRLGHVKACRAMADHLRASAAMGKLADQWPGFDGFHAAADAPAKPAEENAEVKALKDQVAALNTQIADLKAAATRQAPAPERKTLAPQVSALLARNGIALPDGDKKMSVAEVNKLLASSSLDPRQRMEVKGALERAGMLAA